MPLLSIVEHNSREKIVQAVVKGLGSDVAATSFLCISGDDAKFAKCLADQLEAEMFVYATDNEANIENAENEGGVSTVQCDFGDAKQLNITGKFDGIIVKEVLEHYFLNAADFLEAIWKLLKLGGTAVLLLRPSPPFPVPSNMKEIWTKSVPDLELLLKAAENEDYCFESDVQDVSCHVAMKKSDLTDLLFSFPSATELDVNACVENVDDTVSFEDVLTLVCLKKVID